MGQPHTHKHTQRVREGNAQVFLCFCLLSFYYFIPGLVLIHSVCVSGASSSSLPEKGREREGEQSTCSSCSRPLATSPATLSQSQSVCRIASHGIASCSSVFTHGHGYTQLTTYTHTHLHIWVVRVCACKWHLQFSNYWMSDKFCRHDWNWQLRRTVRCTGLASLLLSLSLPSSSSFPLSLSLSPTQGPVTLPSTWSASASVSVSGLACPANGLAKLSLALSPTPTPNEHCENLNKFYENFKPFMHGGAINYLLDFTKFYMVYCIGGR